MRSYRINKHLIVLNLYSALINEIVVMEFMTENFPEYEFDVKYVNTVKSVT